MKQLIVHIEFESDNVDEGAIKDQLDDVLSRFPEDEIGWRFFDSVEEALEWEHGTPGKEKK